MQIVRGDLNRLKVELGPVPESWRSLGGRGLCAQILLDEMNPGSDPLGPEAKLVWAPGLLAGYNLSSCDRISVGGKSPLTGGIKESNAGGTTAERLVSLGIKALILQGQATKDPWWLLELSGDGGVFIPAGDWDDVGVYARAEQVRAQYGEKAAVILIGPGAEMGLRSAGIMNVDQDGRPSRINARGGLGAVMASRGLRAIVLQPGEYQPQPKDRERFLQARRDYTKALVTHPQTEAYADYGTAAMTQMTQRLGALPTRNFSQGSFEGADEISGENLRDLLLSRPEPSLTTHACMPGCAIRCSNVFGSTTGSEIVSPLEYETIALMGSNLGIDDLESIARLNWACNDLGLDTIEIGAALGVAAEAGQWAFGDADAALELLEEVRAGSALGRTIGNGAAWAGREWGVERVPVVKGQAMAAYDPRAIKGTGVTYATSPQGADHTAGLTIRAQIDHRSPQGQVEISRKAQWNMAGYDTLGACIFAGFGFAAARQSVADLVNAIYGWDVSSGVLADLGRKTLALEVAFNRAAGLSAADDRLPAWMKREPLPPTGSVFDVADEDLDRIWTDLD